MTATVLRKIIFLVFILNLESCKKNTSSNPIYETFKIEGTWVLYQYQVLPNSSLILKNDTLKFTSKTDYLYNNIASTYELSNIYSAGSTYRLYFKKTAFGNILGTVPSNFQSIGEINGGSFSPPQTSSSSNLKYGLWLRKI